MYISFINHAASPIYLFIIEEATTFIKLALTFEANALAIKVLPVPGGPYNKTPFGA